MNHDTTHQDYHPQDTDDYLSAAIDRVRKDYGMQDERDGGFTWEWRYNNRPATPAEVIAAERHAKRRAQTLADYDAAPALPEPRRAFNSGTPLTPKVCANPECGITFLPRVASARYHDAVCQKRAARKRSEAKRKASA